MALYALPILLLLVLLFCALLVNFHFGTNIMVLFVLVLLILVGSGRCIQVGCADRDELYVTCGGVCASHGSQLRYSRPTEKLAITQPICDWLTCALVPPALIAPTPPSR